MKVVYRVLSVLFGSSIIVTTVAAATVTIHCPANKVRTEVTTPLPAGWWQTPQVGSLLGVEVKNLQGNQTIFCKYWAYGRHVSVMHKAPVGYRCRASGKKAICTQPQQQAQLALTGTWHASQNARSLAQLKIYKVGNKIKVHAWGVCHPTNCDWGTRNAQFINNRKIIVRFNQGFVTRRIVITKTAPNKIKVYTLSHYTDNSGRGDRRVVEYMYK